MVRGALLVNVLTFLRKMDLTLAPLENNPTYLFSGGWKEAQMMSKVVPSL